MSRTCKYLPPTLCICICLISSMPAYCKSDNCSATVLCTPTNSCASLDDSCTCTVRPPSVSIVCSKWSPQSISYETKSSGYNYIKIKIHGLKGGMPLEFLEWFIPKILPLSHYSYSLEISNFCTDPLKTITGNHISISKLFNNQPSPILTTLKMRNNCLRSITGNMKNHSPYLKELDLSFNKFTQIPKFLDGTDTLEKYDLSHNNIGTVSKIDFNLTLYLEQLNLSHNNLTSLPEDLLFDLIYLEVLDLSHNSISSIPESFVSQSLLLKKFDISNNKLKQIARSFFINPSLIVEINLSHNKFKEIHLAVENLGALKVLSLDSNDIVKVNLTGLEKCKNLKELVLANNSIIHTFKLYTQHDAAINYDLRNNKFRAIMLPPTNFIQNADTLDMSNNCVHLYFVNLNMKESDEYIKNYKCSNCCLNEIVYGMFDNITKSIDISFNNISKLDENDLKAFLNVSQVILSHNQIARVNLTQFEINYRDKTKLVYFDLSYNPFVCDCRLNKFIKYLRNQNATFTFNTQNNFCLYPPEMNGTSLKTIDYNLFCDYPINYPTNCQCRVDDLDNIPSVSIECSNSNLTRFPKIHSYGSSVAVYLNLTRNKISSLPHKDDPIWSQIKILDLSYNRLKSLKNMTILPNLSILYLNNNSLSEFDGKGASLLRLAEIKLSNNPWKCDCKMSKFVIKSRFFEEKYKWLCTKENRSYNFTEFEKICKTFNLFWFLLPILTLVVLVSVIVILFKKYKL